MQTFLRSLLFCFVLALALPARAEKLPASVTIIKADDLLGRPYYSVADALERSGVMNIERAGARGSRALPKLRGLSNTNSTLVMIDGIAINHAYDSQVDLSQISLNIVDRIEITKGGASVSYGPGAIGGVINIITKRPEDKGLSTRLGTGIGRDGAKQHHAQLLSRSYWGDATYLVSRELTGGFMENEGSRGITHFGNLTRSFNGDGFWGVEYYYQDSRAGLPNGTAVPLEQWNGHEEQDSRDRTALKKEEMQQIKFILESPEFWEGRVHTTVSTNHRKYDEFGEPNGPSLLSKDNETTVVQASYRIKTLEAGGDLAQFSRKVFPDKERDANQTGAFIRNKFEMGAVTLLPGIRTDHHSKAGSGLSPRGSVIISLSSTTHISGTLQRGIRFPSFDELYTSSTTVGTTSLNPEKSWSYDVGAEWAPAPWFNIRAASFFLKKSDAIRIDSSNNQYRNEGHERTEGFEGDMSLKISRFKLQFRGTTQKSRQSQPNGDLLDSPLTPRHHFFAGLDTQLPAGLTLVNEIHYQSEQFEGAGKTGIRLPSYYSWDVRLLIKMLKAFAYIEADNVTGQSFADTIVGSPAVLSPQPDRTYWTGITIHFKN